MLVNLTFGRVIERTGNLPVFLKTSVIWQLCSFFRRNQEKTWFRVLKLIFVKHLTQRIPLNHYVCSNLNDLKLLEHQNLVQRMWKADFLTRNYLGTPHPFRLKSDQNAKISHTYHILPRRLQGVFWYYDMNC